jgi:hypothetical protein
MTELNESARQALGISIQILEELPELHRPDSNIEHMRQMLRPHQLSDRDEIILQEAIATALVFRIKSALSAPPPKDQEARFAGRSKRAEDMGALLRVAAFLGKEDMGLSLAEACTRLAAHG